MAHTPAHALTPSRDMLTPHRDGEQAERGKDFGTEKVRKGASWFGRNYYVCEHAAEALRVHSGALDLLVIRFASGLFAMELRLSIRTFSLSWAQCSVSSAIQCSWGLLSRLKSTFCKPDVSPDHSLSSG